MSEKKVPWGVIAGATVIGGGVGGAIFLAYKYFVEPGAQILAAYREVLTDIYKETKKFLVDNEKLDPPIYGLTATQERIIKAKEDVLAELRPQVEKMLASRNININSWFYSLLDVAIVGLVAYIAIPVIKELIKGWRRKPESTSIQSSYGHSYIVHEVVVNEMAALGKTNIAGGFLSTMQNHYSAYAAPMLNAGINYYNALIPTLTPGTLSYLVATSMLTYMTVEVSAVSGIMGALWSFWLPPLI